MHVKYVHIQSAVTDSCAPFQRSVHMRHVHELDESDDRSELFVAIAFQ